jgi:predicted anti-sigma-YlaC factor YlaD
MNIESKLSGHWTDEELIEHLYGVGPDPRHLEDCRQCRERLSAMLAARRVVERQEPASKQVPFDLLASQRRSIYARIGQMRRWQPGVGLRRWAATGAMIALLGGGAFLYEQNQREKAVEKRLTDAQLAQEVSRMAQDSEPLPTAPLQQLFEE